MDTTTPKERTVSEVLTRVIAHSRAGLIGLVAVVVLCLCAVAPAVSSAASANPTTTYGTASISWSVASKKVSGTVSDLSADGYCVRAYTRGRNWALGWANAKYIGQACGKGTSTYISDSASLYGDQLNFMLCRGFGSCVAWRLWPAV